jgi:hypothetical protein
VAGCCECGDEPSGPCTTELVSLVSYMYTVGYEVYHHPPFLLLSLHNIVCKRKLVDFNQYNVRIYT